MKRIAFVLALAGCSSSVGPYVRDVHYRADGALVAEKCTITFSAFAGYGGGIDDEKCHSELVRTEGHK